MPSYRLRSTGVLGCLDHPQDHVVVVALDTSYAAAIRTIELCMCATHPAAFPAAKLIHTQW